eukprot:4744333-Prorocentrum_lima.AAC.1
MQYTTSVKTAASTTVKDRQFFWKGVARTVHFSPVQRSGKSSHVCLELLLCAKCQWFLGWLKRGVQQSVQIDLFNDLPTTYKQNGRNKLGWNWALRQKYSRRRYKNFMSVADKFPNPN